MWKVALLLLAAAPKPPPTPPKSDDIRTPRGRPADRSGGRAATGGVSVAYFSFADTAGVGMGAACACQSVTATAGTAITFTRTGSAFCSTQGLATTGIPNGGLISCAGNKPRVEPTRDGVLGVLTEGPATNYQTYSEDISQWTVTHTTVADPVVTVDQAVAPDGQSTADQVDFPATGAGEASIVYRLADAAQSKTASVYLRGVSGSGTTDLVLNGTVPVSVQCSFVSTSWTRCVLTASAAIDGQFELGPNTLVTGRTYAATSVYVWGIQQERGLIASSYIATAAATASRNAEKLSASITNGITPMCMSGNFDLPAKLYSSGGGSFASYLILWNGGVVDYMTTYPSVGSAATSTVVGQAHFSSSNRQMTSTATVAENTNPRIVFRLQDSTDLSVQVGATNKTTAVTAYTPFTTSSHILYMGMTSGSAQVFNGIVSRVKLDTSVSGCE